MSAQAILLHEYCTNEGPILVKKQQHSTDLVNSTDQIDSLLSAGFKGFFGVLSGDSGRARTADLMLRRPSATHIIPRVFSYLFQKCTNSARKPNWFRLFHEFKNNENLHNLEYFFDCAERYLEIHQQRVEVQHEIDWARGCLSQLSQHHGGGNIGWQNVSQTRRNGRGLGTASYHRL